MIEAPKLVQITPPTEQTRQLITQLDTKAGRAALAEQLTRDIEEWTSKAYDGGPRSHLGASIIAHKCKRHIWYSFRWFYHKQHSGRMHRLWRRGHREEDAFIEYLQGIGCTVEQVSEDGKQIRIYAVSGHFGGSSDGSASLPGSYGISDNFLLEFKTASDSNFGQVHEFRNDKTQHWGQSCVYGYKRGIKYVIYALVNKDNDKIHIEVELLDWTLAMQLIAQADYLIHTQAPPPRISNRIDWWECKMCDHYDLCQTRKIAPERNCRTCVFSQPIADAQWMCTGWNVTIPDKAAQLAGCDNWKGLEY